MDQETVDYIVSYFSNLYTEEEKYTIEIDIVKSFGTAEAFADYEAHYEMGMFSEQEDYLELVKMTAGEFNSILATRLLCDHKDKIFINRGKKCDKLARTPLAKQCRHCGHDWH